MDGIAELIIKAAKANPVFGAMILMALYYIFIKPLFSEPTKDSDKKRAS